MASLPCSIKYLYFRRLARCLSRIQKGPSEEGHFCCDVRVSLGRCRRHPGVLDGDLLDQRADVLSVAFFADDHAKGVTGLPIHTDEKTRFAIGKFVEAAMQPRLAETDLIGIVLLFSHNLAEKSIYPLAFFHLNTGPLINQG